jgi:hypothetical protein
MVDDHTQRPYRSNEPPARGVSAKAPGGASGSDPLAELARLIGQSDPFADRDSARRVAPPLPPEAAHDWDAQPAGAGYGPAPTPNNDYYDPAPAPAAHPQNYGRQQFGGAPLAGEADLYQHETEVPGYPAAQGAGQSADYAAGYEDDRYNQSNVHLAAEEEDFYDDEQPSRRRMGIMVIAGVFALAVIGTAGAFGYRALFGSSSVSGPPPVIKADSAPSKIVPAANIDAQSNKQITDRVNDRGLGEKLVSREEQPVAVSPQAQDQSGSSSPALGSGIVASEPKKVRTIAIHPDQSAVADAAPVSAPPPPPPPARVTATVPAKPAAPVPAPPPAPRVVSNPPPAADDAEPAPPSAPRPAVARAAPPAQQAAPPTASNAPLSLSPDAPVRAAPARAAAPPMRAAAVAAPAPIAAASGGGGGYAVQVSSQRSEAEAQAAFRTLQGKFPGQLGGKQALIHRVDLGEKGVYYRAMVGPFASGSEATELCSSLKAAGGSCIIQRN